MRAAFWVAAVLVCLVGSACSRPVRVEEEIVDRELGFLSECKWKAPPRPRSSIWTRPGRLGVHVATPPRQENTLWDVIQSEKDFLYFRCAIQHLGLKSIFDGSEKEDNITVFIPTNEAFRRLPRDVIKRLLRPEFKEDLIGVLQYHILEGDFTTENFEDGESQETFLGEEVQFHSRTLLEDQEIYLVNQGLLVLEDKEASNGVAHGIDSVLLPDHFMINRSHEHFKNKTIGEILEKVPVFKNLWKAIKGVKLDKVLLDEKSQITFFAPPDYVWKRGPFEQLLDVEKNGEELFDVLKYHIVEDQIFSLTLADGDEVETSQGSKLKVTRTQFLDDGQEDLFVDYAQLRRRDYVFANGVMHILDRPLVPTD